MSRCACGGIILADTEDWTSPLCPNCYEDVHRHFTSQHELFEDYETRQALMRRELDDKKKELELVRGWRDGLVEENTKLMKQLAVAVDGINKHLKSFIRPDVIAPELIETLK